MFELTTWTADGVASWPLLLLGFGNALYAAQLATRAGCSAWRIKRV
jgi:hypothetical protein